jgi:hypothetical protein
LVLVEIDPFSGMDEKPMLVWTEHFLLKINTELGILLKKLKLGLAFLNKNRTELCIFLKKHKLGCAYFRTKQNLGWHTSLGPDALLRFNEIGLCSTVQLYIATQPTFNNT